MSYADIGHDIGPPVRVARRVCKHLVGQRIRRSQASSRCDDIGCFLRHRIRCGCNLRAVVADTATTDPGRGAMTAGASEATGRMGEFKGKIELDIRDSEPDWGPYARSSRAARCAQRPLPGVGRHGHRDLGLLRRPRRDARHEPHRRTRRAAVAVSHHRAVLADPGLAAHRPQRHHRRDGHHRGVHRRLPELQRAHPRRHRAAVRGARRTRLQHLLRGQVASHPARGVQSRCHQTALAAEPRFRAVLRLHGRRDRPVVSRIGLRQPSRSPRPPPPRRATTCRRTWRTRPSSSSATPR